VKSTFKISISQASMAVMMMIFIEQELSSQVNPEYVIDVFKSLHPFDQGLDIFKVMNYNT